ncbi:MAG: starvation-inducible DNA-binding protein [Candidatus Nitrosomirales archaeon]|jgi:starvation-inducible DNA-binding protein
MATSVIMGTEIKPEIALSDNERQGVVEILSRVLSDTYVLYTKTKNYHWNVVGPQFNDLHKFFDSQYKELDEAVDEIAERIRMLGGRSIGTLTEFLQHTELKEEPGRYPDARRMISNLLADHEAIIRNLRADADACDEKYHDMGTNDFLLELMQNHEKMAWMLRAFLEGKSV